MQESIEESWDRRIEDSFTKEAYQQHEQQLNAPVAEQHNDHSANHPTTPTITPSSSSSSVVSNLPLLSDNETPASSSTSDRTPPLKKQKLTHYTQPTLLSMIVDSQSDRVLRALALFFASNHIAHRAVDTPSFPVL